MARRSSFNQEKRKTNMKKVLTLLKKHEDWRRRCINLIASENVMSPLCERVYLSDLMHRYAEGMPFKRYYQGLKYFDQIEDLTNKYFQKHFKCNFVDLRPISGTLANLAVFSALAKKGDKILTLGIEGGSHVSHEKFGAAGLLGLKVYHFDFDKKELNIDLERAKKKILKIKPKFIVLGGSVILFPQPVKELKEVCQKTGTKIIYDAAHVFGLICAGYFQNPLKEGADIITSSTHKTFPGPQGGIILGNIDEDLQKVIRRKVFPGVSSNHHLHRIPALYLTLLEMEKFGKGYGKQIIKNAKTLAEELYHLGFDVLGADKDFTQTHQVVVNVEKDGGGDFVAKQLERANIIVNKNVLFGDIVDVKHPNGIRIGVQEMTRFGMKENEMKKIARFMKEVILDKKNVEKIKKAVIKFRKEFQRTKYCF
ncbi:MAG: serine hydroxymethyltransferase [Candidatus Nealsonbacteria bacterium CG_4_10_14_0_8_um_filter_35_10]|uniref:Serine hydroxymethyltransferase n=1 Tax=Candidatus Nealsonbacteria bacterium CG_4_10_14_0_8_um_filter_35_10 TaxID=1974683 RepID=A0A2M7R8L6_9BACT|nr:MAG: serine hydroxymethyltransferase [Candidatus Nealsonbacteria bacterium CG_4_10_14_0_8_um_filter_35_10]